MTSTQWILDSIDVLNEYLWTYVVIVMLVGCAIYFTVRSKGVQFRLLKDMVKIIIDRPIYNNKVEGKAQASSNDERLKKIGSFQAFAVSLSSRVGTGNLAGVASAIFVGGPGAVFWMWVMAMFGAATAFVDTGRYSGTDRMIAQRTAIDTAITPKNFSVLARTVHTNIFVSSDSF